MEHGVAHRDEDAEGQDQTAGQRQPGAGALDDGLDGDAHGDRESGDAQLVEQSPAKSLELSAELIAPEPVQEAWARPYIGVAGIRIRKIANLHDVPGLGMREVRADLGDTG